MSCNNNLPFKVVETGALLDDELMQTFSCLVKDDYHPDGSRFRRFSQFRLSSSGERTKLDKLDIRPFTQKVTNNKLVGNILRYFPSINCDISRIILHGFTESGLTKEIDWQVNCHQVRVVNSSNQAGRAAPEGIHRDGVNYIFMVCVNRGNINGGVSEIYDDDQNLIYKRALRGGEALLVNDQEVYHNVTEFYLNEGASSGHRDMLIIAYMPWAEGRYGPVYEKTVTGAEADLDLITEVATK